MHLLRHRHSLLSLLLLSAAVLFAACEEDETDLGVNMQDPSTLYNGKSATIVGKDSISACTIFDTNLLTSGYLTAMVGNYYDATYGSVAATTFAQFALSGTSINFSNFAIDSAILTLVATEHLAVSDDAVRVRFRIQQLNNAIDNDSSYRSTDDISTSNTLFLDTTLDLTLADTNTTLRFKLNSNFIDLLKQQEYPDQDNFLQTTKGVCLEFAKEDSDPVICTFDFAKTASGIEVFYTHDEVQDRYQLLLGKVSTTSPSTHFCQFRHQYSGDLARLQQHAIDSIEGTTKLFLEPLGGTAVKICINDYVKHFHQLHPRAVIHYAELLLPIHDDADSHRPSKIVAYKNYESGNSLFISDILTTYDGYDGGFHADSNYYRLRITQHLQTLMCAGGDQGTTLYLDGRRSSAFRTILNGTASDTPLKINFIYTE